MVASQWFLSDDRSSKCKSAEWPYYQVSFTFAGDLLMPISPVALFTSFGIVDARQHSFGERDENPLGITLESAMAFVVKTEEFYNKYISSDYWKYEMQQRVESLRNVDPSNDACDDDLIAYHVAEQTIRELRNAGLTEAYYVQNMHQLVCASCERVTRTAFVVFRVPPMSAVWSTTSYCTNRWTKQ